MLFWMPILILLAVWVLALALGGPKAPPALETIVGPFKTADYSTLPSQEFIEARDGTRLAFRRYLAGENKHWVVLIHGSSSRNDSMHPLALDLSRAGWNVLVPDVRGHGDSGPRGTLRYIGQLEDDLEDLLNRVQLPGPKFLAGFSSGGGFALRFAGSARQDLFDGYLLLSPFLHPQASTSRPGSGGWVGVGIPRIIALVLLNRLGITALNGLPVLSFALPEWRKKVMTPEYSFSLMSNFQPHEDYRSDFSNAHRPMRLLAGDKDEIFIAENFEGEIQKAGGTAKVHLVPGLSHVGLILDPTGIQAIGEALKELNSFLI